MKTLISNLMTTIIYFVIFHNHLPFWGGVKALSYKPYFIIVNMYYVCALFCMYFCDIKGQVDFANHGKS